MKSYDEGHRETQTALPEPLASTGFWRVGALALPATLLSAASAAVFGMVLGFLEAGGERQKLFVLPMPGAACIAAAAAGLTWWIAARCRRRPGRVWPRIWAVALACLSSAITILALVFPDRSWALALTVAGLAAAITLAPRLVKLRPDSAMVQHVAPLSLVLILIVILPLSCAVRQVIVKATEQRVDQHIRQMQIWTEDVEQITGFDWSRLEESPGQAASGVRQLGMLCFDCGKDDAELWRLAAILGRDGDLARATQRLTEAVVAGLAPDRVPRVSRLKEPAVRWDDQDKRWQSYTQFPALSETTGGYYRQLGRLFDELGTDRVDAESAPLVDCRQHHAAQRELLRKYLNETGGSWADNWAVFEVPDHAALIGRDRMPLDELLRAPFVKGEEGVYAAADLWQLSSLPLYRVRRLAQGSPGCESGGHKERKQLAPGCHCQNFGEGEHEYFRLDCYSYAPRKEGTGAELRVEMRLVYRSERGRRLSESSWPIEIYFHFLIPQGEENDRFREEVMTSLAAAARGSLEEGIVRSTDKGGSVAGGFVIDGNGSPVRVLRPSVVSLSGLDPEPRALLVRVVRRG